jgi:hypothetical protein
MDVFIDKKRLLDLVKGAQEGKVVLPEFQRDFVWPRDDIRDLLVSIANDHYIGSLLLLRTDYEHMPFAPRPIAGVEKSIDTLKPEYMVLDGQQRMTALHYAFAAPPIPLRDTKRPYRYFLDFGKVASGDLEQAITYERDDRCVDLLERQRQFETFVVPFTELLNFESWLEACDDWYYQNDRAKYEQIFRPARASWRSMIRRFEDFMAPTSEIDKVAPNDINRIAEVCAIFEKLNSTGVRLSVFDLLTARLFRYGIRLRELWDEAREASDLLKQHAEEDIPGYQVLVLRTIGLIRQIDVKAKTLIALDAKNFEEDWYEAVDALELALKRVHSTNEDGFGAFKPKWLPYSTMLPVLAAVLYYIKEHKLGNEAYRALRKWYWGSLFLERYAGTVESTTYRDYQDLLTRFDDQTSMPVAFKEINDQLLNNPQFSLLGASRVNSVYRGVMNLLAIRGAKDFYTGDAIDFHTLNDHHIFPDSMLRKEKDSDGKPQYKSEQINVILNRTLISDDTNQSIKSKRPSDYLGNMPASKRTTILETHFITKQTLAAIEQDDYGNFLRYREIAILSYLRNLLKEV